MKKDPLQPRRIAHAAKTMRRSLPEGFCAAPFRQMFVYPTGDVFVCCEGMGHLGNLKDRTLEQMWNGPEVKKLRNEFLEGNPLQCRKNIDCKKCHEGYDDLLPELVPSETQEAPPSSLDLIVDGTCNIDCIMCEVKDQRQSLLALPQFHAEIAEKVFPTVKKISLKSGEPFVQKHTYALIDQVSRINPECTWSFTTNGQYVFNSRIREALEKVRIGRLTFSVDAVDSRLFQEIRVRGTLERLRAAMDGMIEWSKSKVQDTPVQFAVNVTLQKKNWRDVPNVLKHFHERGIPAWILFVEKPEEFSLSTLPGPEIAEVLNHYLDLPAEFEPFLPALLQAVTPLLRDAKDPLIRKLGAMIKLRITAAASRRKTMCPFPFTQLSLFPDGSFKPCCWLGSHDLRNKKGEGILETWNGAKMKALRLEHLSGESKTCGDLMTRVGCHKMHPSMSQMMDPREAQDGPVLRLDWFFSGKCNLECPSCNNWQQSEEPPEAEANWEMLKRDVLPYLCEIDLKGGEPFFQKRTFQLMEEMARVNPHCVWEITSNGQIRFNDRIRALLDRLLIGYFSVSIDSLDPALFARLRKGGTLSKTLGFLDELIALNRARPIGRRFNIVLNYVVQRANWRETESIVRFAQEKGVGLYLLPLVNPPELSVHTLPLEERRAAFEHVDALAAKHDVKSLRDLRAVLAPSVGAN